MRRIRILRGARGVGGPEDFTPAFSDIEIVQKVVHSIYGRRTRTRNVFPDRPGTIIPNDDIVAPTAVNATFDISAVDAAGVEDLLTINGATLLI